MAWHHLRRQSDGDHAAALAGRRFVTLDAMRGVAAISVMFFHYLLGTSCHIFEHGFYAVDFFFVLSGIVLIHSYGVKIQNKMAFLDYMKARMIRLYPLYAFGFLLGILIFPFYISHSLTVGFGYKDYALSMICGTVFLPYPNDGTVPLAADATMSGALFPLDIPAWSLFFEVLASIGLFVFLKSRVKAEHVVALSFVALVIAWRFYRTVNVGWGLNTILGGFPRTAFAFFFGVLIYRALSGANGLRISPSPSVLLVATAIMFALPSRLDERHIPGGVLCMILIPLLISLALLVGRQDEQRRFFVWLGKISYSIYAIHVPVYGIAFFVLHRTLWGREADHSPLLTACLLVALVIVIAHLLTSAFDEPVRRWLKGVASARSY